MVSKCARRLYLISWICDIKNILQPPKIIVVVFGDWFRSAPSNQTFNGGGSVCVVFFSFFSRHFHLGNVFTKSNRGHFLIIFIWCSFLYYTKHPGHPIYFCWPSPYSLPSSCQVDDFSLLFIMIFSLFISSNVIKISCIPVLSAFLFSFFYSLFLFLLPSPASSHFHCVHVMFILFILFIFLICMCFHVTAFWRRHISI